MTKEGVAYELEAIQANQVRLESLEEWLEKAVRELPQGSDLLAQVLIAIVETVEEASVVGG
jgi:hypothetical protein